MSQSPDELSSDPNLSDILEALAEDPLFEKEVEQLCNSPMSMTGVMLQPLDSPKNQSVTMMSGVELEPLDTPKLPDATMMSGVELQPLDPPKLPDTNMMSGVELQPLDTPKFPDTNMMSGVKLQRLDTQKLPDVRMMPGVQLLNGTSPQLQNPTLRPGLEAEAEKPQKAPIRTIRTKPRVEIVEQPASKGLRFRYKCEGRLAGSIPGANSTRKKKTFPTIRIHGHPGKAIVIVSCVTADPPYRPHPHNLVGKEQCNKGICVVPMPPNLTYSFTNLGIQCVKRRDMRESLEQRELEHLDPFRTGFEHKYKTNLINQAVVRLCFQVFLETPATGGLCTYPLPPVLSNPIIDKKTTSDLIIYKMSHASASAFGGEEILVLCEKVVKGDIRVRFYEGNENNPTWEDFATFKPNYVHKQVALSFRSPCYRNKYIQEPVKVFVQLVRPSDGETSDSLPFQLLPKEGRLNFRSLRKSFSERDKILGHDFYLSQRTSYLARSFDDFNNNDPVAKRAHGKFSALRALNDLYKYNLEMRNGNAEPNLNIVNEFVGKRNSFNQENGKLTKEVSDWFDYSEVDKWVRNHESPEKTLETETENEKPEKDGVLNEILPEVAEIDQIYEDTHVKLKQNACDEKSKEFDVDDNKTYTSLQMAMKNPIEVVSPIIAVAPPLPPPLAPKREVVKEVTIDTTVPPLPPKRIRKAPSLPVLSQISSQTVHQSAPTAPHKILPCPPGTLQKSKPSLFSKLFAKKSKRDQELNITPVFTALPITGSTPNISNHVVNVNVSRIEDDTPPCIADLTEAEHYALYTDMAPHATASEFDEMSCYYSPVEGGKIIGAEGS